MPKIKLPLKLLLAVGVLAPDELVEVARIFVILPLLVPPGIVFCEIVGVAGADVFALELNTVLLVSLVLGEGIGVVTGRKKRSLFKSIGGVIIFVVFSVFVVFVMIELVGGVEFAAVFELIAVLIAVGVVLAGLGAFDGESNKLFAESLLASFVSLLSFSPVGFAGSGLPFDKNDLTREGASSSFMLTGIEFVLVFAGIGGAFFNFFSCDIASSFSLPAAINSASRF